jgi:hypothetical protein
MHRPSVSSFFYEELGYYRNINTHTRWRHRKAIEQALGSAMNLPRRWVLPKRGRVCQNANAAD